MWDGVLRSLSVVLFVLAGVTAPASALDVPDPPRDYVLDRAAILSPAAHAQLSRVLAQFEAQTSHQVLVATFPSLEQESLEDFSIRLAERWQAGQTGKDNGVTLLVFRDERLLRIEVGYGLEGALPDALGDTIIRNDIAPLFRQGAYEQGLLRGVQSILQAVQGEYQADALAERHAGGDHRHQELTPEQAAAMRRQGGMLLAVVLVSLLGLLLVDVFRYRGYRRDHRRYAERYSFWEWFFRFALLLAVVTLIFRMLFYAMLFSRGGVYGGGRGGGGGFSGGGGSFGGGGASGRW